MRKRHGLTEELQQLLEHHLSRLGRFFTCGRKLHGSRFTFRKLHGSVFFFSSPPQVFIFLLKVRACASVSGACARLCAGFRAQVFLRLAVDVFARKLCCASAPAQAALCKVFCAVRFMQVSPRQLLCLFAWQTVCALTSCDFRAQAVNMYLARCFQSASCNFPSPAANALRVAGEVHFVYYFRT